MSLLSRRFEARRSLPSHCEGRLNCCYTLRPCADKREESVPLSFEKALELSDLGLLLDMLFALVSSIMVQLLILSCLSTLGRGFLFVTGLQPFLVALILAKIVTAP